MGIKKLSKSKKPRTIVSFDEEIVTKDNAVELLTESLNIVQDEYEGKFSYGSKSKPHENSERKVQTNELINNESSNSNANEICLKKKIKKRKIENERNEKQNEEYNVDNSSTKMPSKKRKKNKLMVEMESKLETEENKRVEENSPMKIKSKKRKKNKNPDEVATKPKTEGNEWIEENSLTKMKDKIRNKNKYLDELEIKPEMGEHEPIAEKSLTKIKSKKQKTNESSEESKIKPDSKDNEVGAENSKTKKELSIRAQKRMKHEKLLEDKRSKAAMVNQQNVLNYLSKWKHARNEWKFEKLRQIWLQQNLFDSSKIPSEFWDTAVDYFSGSKGFIRKCVLRDALKIVEKAEGSEDTDEKHQLVLKRAHDIIQHLQE